MPFLAKTKALISRKCKKDGAPSSPSLTSHSSESLASAPSIALEPIVYDDFISADVLDTLKGRVHPRFKNSKTPELEQGFVTRRPKIDGAFPLLRLPPELITVILTHCDLSSRRAFTCTSKYLYGLGSPLCFSTAGYTTIQLPLYAGPITRLEERILEGFRRGGTLKGGGRLNSKEWEAAWEENREKLRDIRRLVIETRADVEAGWARGANPNIGRSIREASVGICPGGDHYLQRKETLWVSDNGIVRVDGLEKDVVKRIEEDMAALREGLEEVRVRVLTRMSERTEAEMLRRHKNDGPQELSSHLYHLLEKLQPPRVELALYNPPDAEGKLAPPVRIAAGNPFLTHSGEMVRHYGLSGTLTDAFARLNLSGWALDSLDYSYLIPFFSMVAKDGPSSHTPSLNIPEEPPAPEERMLYLSNRLPGTRLTHTEDERSSSFQILQDAPPPSPHSSTTSRFKHALLSSSSAKAQISSLQRRKWEQTRARAQLFESYLPVKFVFPDPLVYPLNLHFAITYLHLEGLMLEFISYPIIASLKAPARLVMRNCKLVGSFEHEYPVARVPDDHADGWDRFFAEASYKGGRVGTFDARLLWEMDTTGHWTSEFASHRWRAWLTEGIDEYTYSAKMYSDLGCIMMVGDS